MPLTAVQRRDVARERVAALGIRAAAARPAPAGDIAATVTALGALQAQEWASGLWSVGVRTGRTAAEVEQAIERREIVRTWPMRGTLHLVPAADARWMCRLLAGRHLAAAARIHERQGLTTAVVDRGRQVLLDVLTGAGPRSRPELFGVLGAAGIDPGAGRGYHLLSRLCMEGLLVQGPPAGKQPSFVVLDEWVPAGNDPAPEQGLATLAERYLRSHGPVTEADLAGWLAAPLGVARAGLAALGDRVVRQRVGDLDLLQHADAPEPVAAGHVQLLPPWDEYLLGYRDRHAQLAPEFRPRIVPAVNMSFQPTLVVGGQVAGLWQRRSTRREVTVTVTPEPPRHVRRLTGLTAPAVPGLGFERSRGPRLRRAVCRRSTRRSGGG